MFNKYFEKYNYFAITECNDKICVVPCDNRMSGIYPDYDKVEYLYDDTIKFNNKLYNSDNKMMAEIDAILFIKQGETFEMYYAEDSWDGFQIISDDGSNEE